MANVPSVLLKSFRRIGRRLEEHEARLQDPERIRKEKEEQSYSESLQFYRDRAGVYLQAVRCTLLSVDNFADAYGL